MSWSISTLNTFPTTTSLVRGFTIPGNIFLAAPSDGVLEEMNVATGAVVANRAAGAAAWLALHDPIAGRFWTTSAGGGGSVIVSRFNAAGVLLNNPVVGLRPYGQCIGNGRYWVACYGDNTVHVLNSVTGVHLATVAGIVDASDGTGACLYDGVNIWVTGNGDNTLYQINEATQTLTNTFNPVGVSRWGGLILANGSLWGTDRNNLLLVQMDLAGNVLNLFPVSAAGPLAFDGTNFWLLSFAGFFELVSPAGASLATGITAGSPQWISTDGQLSSGEYVAGTPNQAWVTSSNTPGVIQQFLAVQSIPVKRKLPQIPPFVLPYKLCGPCRKGRIL